MSRAQRLAVVLLLNLALVAGLVVVGLGAHSLGVLAAGVDYLADASAIGVSLLAIWLARRPGGRYRNATNVAAVINAGWMLVVSIAVVAGGVQRLVSGTPHVDGRPVLIASAVAAAAMLCGALVLREGTGGAGGEDLNVKAVLLDTAADAAAAGGVALTGAIILATHGWYWLDPAVAMIIAVVVGYQALGLVWKALTALRRPMRSRHAENPEM